MVRAADQRLDEVAAEARAAQAAAQALEEERRELQEEMEAQAELAAQEEAALRETVEELEERLRLAGVGGSQAGDEELKKQLAVLTDKLAQAEMQAMRSAAKEEDALSELQAVEELAAQREAELMAAVEELEQRVLIAERNAQRPPVDDADGRMQELEGQVSELLCMLEGQQSLADELLQLRPKAAKCDALQRELDRMRTGVAADDEGEGDEGDAT